MAPSRTCWTLVGARSIAEHDSRTDTVGSTGDRMDDNEGELVPGAASSRGNKLTARWGPTRWLAGNKWHDPAAYAPDGETIWFVAGDTLRAFNRAGRPVGEPYRVPGATSQLALGSDGRHAAFVRDGRRIWSRRLVPDPALVGDTSPGGQALSVDARTVRVIDAWFGRDQEYGDRDWRSDRTIVTTFALDDGRITAEPALERESERESATGRRFRMASAGGAVLVDGEPLAVDPSLGEPSGIVPSPDERTLLISTRAGLLLRFERG